MFAFLWAFYSLELFKSIATLWIVLLFGITFECIFGRIGEFLLIFLLLFVILNFIQFIIAVDIDECSNILNELKVVSISDLIKLVEPNEICLYDGDVITSAWANGDCCFLAFLLENSNCVQLRALSYDYYCWCECGVKSTPKLYLNQRILERRIYVFFLYILLRLRKLFVLLDEIWIKSFCDFDWNWWF